VAGWLFGDIDFHFCVAGMARMALGWLRWRAWAGVGRGDAAAVGVAGVAFGDMHLGSTWQAWHSVTSTSTFLCLCFLPGMDDYRPQGMQKKNAKFAVA